MANSMSIYRQNGVDYIIDDPTVAPVFVTTASYSIGQYVKHEGNLYRFTSAHSAGNWNASQVTQVRIDTELIGKLSSNVIAPNFSTNSVYRIGDWVIYNGKLYKFTVYHSQGAWNSSHVQEISVGGETITKKDVSFASMVVSGNFTAVNYDESSAYNAGDWVKVEYELGYIFCKCVKDVPANSDIELSNREYWEQQSELLNQFSQVSDCYINHGGALTISNEAEKTYDAFNNQLGLIKVENIGVSKKRVRFDRDPEEQDWDSFKVRYEASLGIKKWLVGFTYKLNVRRPWSLPSDSSTYPGCEAVYIQIGGEEYELDSTESSRAVSGEPAWYYFAQVVTTDLTRITIEVSHTVDDWAIPDVLEIGNLYVYDITDMEELYIPMIIREQASSNTYQESDGIYYGPAIYALDDTLTETGKIPDSKAVGDAITALDAKTTIATVAETKAYLGIE